MPLGGVALIISHDAPEDIFFSEIANKCSLENKQSLAIEKVAPEEI